MIIQAIPLYSNLGGARREGCGFARRCSGSVGTKFFGVANFLQFGSKDATPEHFCGASVVSLYHICTDRSFVCHLFQGS